MRKERLCNSLKISKFTRVVCYEPKENFTPVMLIKGKISKQHDNFEIYKIVCYEKKKI